MKNWILDRLTERSTWLGLVSFITAMGISLNPEQTDALIAAGAATAGLIAAMTRG